MNTTCQECGHTQEVHCRGLIDVPTTEGWYWYTSVEYGHPVVLHVLNRPGHNYLCVEVDGFNGKRDFRPVKRMSGQWSERIPEPL